MSDVLMPRLSDTMEEGVLSLWLKHEGDSVSKGDALAEIETDKATMELEAYEDGVLEQVLVPEGTTVAIGGRLAVIGDGSGSGSRATAGGPPAQTGATPQPTAAETSSSTAPSSPTSDVATPLGATAAPGGQLRTSPLARRIAKEHGIDLAQVSGTGPGGRIVRADVEAAVQQGRRAPQPAGGTKGAPAAPGTAPSATVAAPVAQPLPDDEVVPLTAVRRITAERLTQSAAAPQFYLTAVVEADRLLALRKDVNAGLASRSTDGAAVKVSVTDLLVRVCALVLRQHPEVNASWGGDAILRHRRVNVGVAVAMDDGLIVPVVHDADTLPLADIAARTRDLAERARAGRLKPDEFSGGTFTISNLGMYGIDHFTAVVNPPEAAILAVGAGTQEPVVRDGEVVVRTIIKLTLTSDHRVLDGATSAAFLRDLKAALENPLSVLV
ncbi:MAG TPA: dihydrolipoamide acetyltransferase family protein [Actinomycetales bacterium]|nr:dihydrolipoamide acetyltransferase family protein [Actinomycetales bacterium]